MDRAGTTSGIAFRTTPSAGAVTVELPTRVDVANSRVFVEVLQAQLDLHYLHIVLDFSKTEAIDSTALGVIVQVFKLLRERGGQLSLCEVGPGVRRVLAITRVDRVFPIYDTLTAALNPTQSA